MQMELHMCLVLLSLLILKIYYLRSSGVKRLCLLRMQQLVSLLQSPEVVQLLTGSIIFLLVYIYQSCYYMIAVHHAYGVADVAGVTVPASTENLLYRNCRHPVEEPAQDACTGFTAPISRDGKSTDWILSLCC